MEAGRAEIDRKKSKLPIRDSRPTLGNTTLEEIVMRVMANFQGLTFEYVLSQPISIIQMASQYSDFKIHADRYDKSYFRTIIRL